MILHFRKDVERIKYVISKFRHNNKKIIFTNGCFDILHLGHVHLLKKAKDLGDILMVGLNSDESVRKIKGKNRPINDEIQRAKVLDAIRYVDYVIIFDDETPLKLIKLIKPDVLVKGAEWKVDEIIGREYAKEIYRIKMVKGYSTTGIIEKIKSIV